MLEALSLGEVELVLLGSAALGIADAAAGRMCMARIVGEYRRIIWGFNMIWGYHAR